MGTSLRENMILGMLLLLPDIIASKLPLTDKRDNLSEFSGINQTFFTFFFEEETSGEDDDVIFFGDDTDYISHPRAEEKDFYDSDSSTNSTDDYENDSYAQLTY